MAPRLLTAFQVASAVATRLPPALLGPLAKLGGTGAAIPDATRRFLVARNLRRIDPNLSGLALRRAVNATFESYAAYWLEAFRLPSLTPEELDAGMTYEGYEHIERSLHRGRGTILVLPHLGGWEWTGFWFTRVVGVPISAVVERLEPPELFDWFTEFRTSLGINVVPLGPDAGREVLAAVKRNDLVCLLSDRDIEGNGRRGRVLRRADHPARRPGDAGAADRGRSRAGRHVPATRWRPPRPHPPADPRRAAGNAPRRRHPHHPAHRRRARGADPARAHPVAPDVTQLAQRPRRPRRGRLGMRIGMMCPYSVTIPGGVQGQVLGLARALRAMGHPTRVLAPSDGVPPDAGVTPLGVSVPTSANGSVAPVAPDPSAQLRTIRVIRDEDFDVLHLHEPLAPGPNMTALLLNAVPMIGTFHAAGDSASYRYAAPVLRWGLRRLRHRCAVSPDAAALAHRYLGGEYELLHNGIEIERYATGPATPTDGPTIFFCGRHEPRKGLAVLLESLSDLPADVRVWIGSDGPETERLQAAYAGDPRIEWLGRITDEEKIARLRGADVFCAPALMGESFGVVLLEAMAAGTAVVASDLDGYRNVATHGVDALLAPVGDAAGLAARSGRSWATTSCRAGLVAAGRTRAAQFSMAASRRAVRRAVRDDRRRSTRRCSTATAYCSDRVPRTAECPT